jgi:hypothetical protein
MDLYSKSKSKSKHTLGALFELVWFLWHKTFKFCRSLYQSLFGLMNVSFEDWNFDFQKSMVTARNWSKDSSLVCLFRPRIFLARTAKSLFPNSPRGANKSTKSNKDFKILWYFFQDFWDFVKDFWDIWDFFLTLLGFLIIF